MTQTNWMDKTVCLIIGPKLEAEVARLTEEREEWKEKYEECNQQFHASENEIQCLTAQNARLLDALEKAKGQRNNYIHKFLLAFGFSYESLDAEKAKRIAEFDAALADGEAE